MKKLILFFGLCLLIACQAPKNQAEKFALINQSLEEANRLRFQASIQGIQNMARLPEAETNSSEYSELVLHKAAIIMAKTEAILQKVEDLKTEIKSIKSNLADKDEVYRIFFKEKKGEKLKRNLNEFVQYINTNYQDLGIKPFPKIWQVHNQYSMHENGIQPIQMALFESASSTQATIWLTFTQQQIIHYIQEVLRKSGAGDLSWSFSTDRYIPVAVAKSDIVRQGEIYEMDVFLSSTNNHKITRNMDIKANGQVISQDMSGNYAFQLLVPKMGKYDYTATLTTPYRGKDTTFVFKENYQVVPRKQLDSAYFNFITLRKFLQ